MTEVEWLAAAGPGEVYLTYPNFGPNQLLRHLSQQHKTDRSKVGRRKLRLFACACSRRFWNSLSEPSRTAVEIAERYVDGDASKKDLGYAWRISIREQGYGPRTVDGIAGHAVEPKAMTAASLVSMVSYSVVAQTFNQTDELWGELHEQSSILHDLFGNPFRDSQATASQFASHDALREQASDIYHRGHFDRVHELETPLKLAGCSDETILEHCRKLKHFRGCWLLDVLRGAA